MRAEAILPARTETGGLKPGRWSRSDHHSLDVQSRRYTPPAGSDGARTINGLDLPEGYGLMGPAGDEQQGAAMLERRGMTKQDRASLDSPSNADARDLRLSNSYRQRMSVELAKVDAEAAHQIRLAEGPGVSAWDGVNRDRYASDRINLEKAMIIPQLTTATMGVGWAWGARGLATADNLLGWKTTATIGGGVSGLMDATMQIYDTGQLRVEQTLVATTVGAASGPLGASGKLLTNMVLGGSGAAINTQFQNSYYGDEKNLGVPVLVGGVFGALGYKVGERATKTFSYYQPERYFANHNPGVPALFQPIVINRAPQVFGVNAGGVASGFSPVGESAIKNLSNPAPKKP